MKKDKTNLINTGHEELNVEAHKIIRYDAELKKYELLIDQLRK